jgi:hypothetical protein
MSGRRSIEPTIGMLFTTDWKAPWSNPKGKAKVTVWHTQLLLCKVTDIDSHNMEYEVLTVLEESGRPPVNARSTTGGGISLDAIRTGSVTLTPPTPQQIAMLPRTARDIGETLEQGYRIPKAYARRGLTLEHTGGGCTALVLEFTSGMQALVTRAEDALAPTTHTEAVDVGAYGPDTGETLDYRLCANAEEAIAHLDELASKYSPAHLPDPRQLARDALLGAILQIRSRLGVPPGLELGSFPDDGEDSERFIQSLTRYGQSVIYALMHERLRLPAELPTAGRLARAFAEQLTAALHAEQVAEVVKRNRDDPLAQSGAVCHSHDFIDANECMIRAWVRLTRTDIDSGSSTHAALMNDAWRLAARADFLPPSIDA